MDVLFHPALLQTRGLLLHFLWGFCVAGVAFVVWLTAASKEAHTTQPTVKIVQI